MKEDNITFKTQAICSDFHKKYVFIAFIQEFHEFPR